MQKRCRFSQGKVSVRSPVHVAAPLRVYVAQLSGVGGRSGRFAPGAPKRTRASGETRRRRRVGEPAGAGRAAPRPPLLPPAGCASRAPRDRASAPPPGLRPGAPLPLGDIKAPAEGRAWRRPRFGFPVADQVLEERAAGEQARRHELQQQGQQESGGQREPHHAKGVQHPERRPSPGSHGRAASALPGPPAPAGAGPAPRAPRAGLGRAGGRAGLR